MAIVKLPTLITGSVADAAFFLALAQAVNGKGVKKPFALAQAVHNQPIAHNMGTTFGWAAGDYFVEVRAYDASGAGLLGISVGKLDANTVALLFDDTTVTLANATFVLDFTLF